MIKSLIPAVALACLIAGCLSEEQINKAKKAVDDTMECDPRTQRLVPKEPMLQIVVDGSITPSMFCGVRKSDNKVSCWESQYCP